MPPTRVPPAPPPDPGQGEGALAVDFGCWDRAGGTEPGEKKEEEEEEVLEAPGALPQIPFFHPKTSGAGSRTRLDAFWGAPPRPSAVDAFWGAAAPAPRRRFAHVGSLAPRKRRCTFPSVKPQPFFFFLLLFRRAFCFLESPDCRRARGKRREWRGPRVPGSARRRTPQISHLEPGTVEETSPPLIVLKFPVPPWNVSCPARGTGRHRAVTAPAGPGQVRSRRRFWHGFRGINSAL